MSALEPVLHHLFEYQVHVTNLKKGKKKDLIKEKFDFK